MSKYLIGLDFGTSGGRCVIADAGNGRLAASVERPYDQGVRETGLPDGWAIQDPRDWLDCMERMIPEAMAEAGISPGELAGIGLDCTASTLFPVDAAGTPLCWRADLRENPHAWAKLWKHHAAQPLASRMTALAQERREPWLADYGGLVSSEWAMPKIWQLVREAPEVLRETDRIVEAGDWLVTQLTGVRGLSSCSAGYKYFMNPDGGPDRAYYEALDPALAGVLDRVLPRERLTSGGFAGRLTPEAAARLGLLPGVPVAGAHIDAHVTPPVAGLEQAGDMLIIMGTSSCQMMLGAEKKPIPGIFGVVRDGLMPGYAGYETGQSAVGDLFAWAARVCPPPEAHGDPHRELTALASRLRPGESGLLALDWLNGNRSILNNADLSGMILGLTLQTRPEEIYRAMLEASAFGMRKIMENYETHGLPVKQVYVTGGISRKNPLAVRILTDVLRRPLQVVPADCGSALGSAIHAAVAGGVYPDLLTASRAMRPQPLPALLPEPDSARVYDRLYAEFDRLHDLFGRGAVDTLQRLRAIRAESGVAP